MVAFSQSSSTLTCLLLPGIPKRLSGNNRRKKRPNREPIQVCILSVCCTPQLRESTLESTAVGQADSTTVCFPDAQYSHSNIADVTIPKQRKGISQVWPWLKFPQGVVLNYLCCRHNICVVGFFFLKAHSQRWTCALGQGLMWHTFLQIANVWVQQFLNASTECKIKVRHTITTHTQQFHKHQCRMEVTHHNK